MFKGSTICNWAAPCLALAFFSSTLSAQPAHFRPGHLILIPKAGHEEELQKLQNRKHHRLKKRFDHLGGIRLIETDGSEDVAALAREYEKSGAVEIAEPDYILRASTIPNDPGFSQLWALHSDSAHDTDAPEAWDTVLSGEPVLVAVIDSGVRYTHEDLAANMWVNPRETANGLDDDGNGFIDDLHGINALAGTGNPADDNGHGTHVAGTIGAVANNAKGVAGICWNVRIMALKFMDNTGEGDTSDAISCIDYARANGAKVINASWGSSYGSRALRTAISSARSAGIIFVAAAGNEDSNNDLYPSYPANFALDNLISVAATDSSGELDSNYSNYGLRTVDLGAPGTGIYSTWNTSDSAYRTISGTSMATPHVTGAIALLRSAYPSESYTQIIARLYAATDKIPSLLGKTVTGGRLNIGKLFPHSMASTNSAASFSLAAGVSNGQFVLSLPPGSSLVLESSTNLIDWAVEPGGAARETLSLPASEERRFYRASAGTAAVIP